MTREKQIRSAAYEASMTEETIVREEVIKDGVQVGYKDIKLRDSDRPIARLFFRKGVEWADANPCMPDKVVKIPERSREEIKELLANWKGTLVVGDDISLSLWISVEDKLPEEHTDVIVTDGSNVAHCKKYGDGFYTNIGKCCNVTHWMPIPELPKEDIV